MSYALAYRGVESPQKVYEYLENKGFSPMPSGDVKKVINLVFFNSKMASIDPRDMTFLQDIDGMCMRGWKPLHNYQPLK